MRMQKNPNRVTKFGASHSGRSLTKAFHFNLSAVAIDSRAHFVHSASGHNLRWVTCQRWSICSSEDFAVLLAKGDLLYLVSSVLVRSLQGYVRVPLAIFSVDAETNSKARRYDSQWKVSKKPITRGAKNVKAKILKLSY